MNWLRRLCDKTSLTAIGLMSGTSLDGLDIVAIKIDCSGEKPLFSVSSYSCRPYTDQVRKLIHGISEPDIHCAGKIASLNFFFGHLFSGYVLDFLDREKMLSSEIDFIASHGHTIHHHPTQGKVSDSVFGSTMQVGDPAVIANRTEILTVGDFRIGDMALGGQGAPLVPFFDVLYLRDEKRNRLILNIGGIANITAMPAGSNNEDVLAFDTGPGNILINSLVKHFYSLPYDDAGRLARKGKIDAGLLEHLLQHEYFGRSMPKSTDIEMFTGDFLRNIIESGKEKGVSPNDLISTATELTARTINDAVRKILAKNVEWDELIISGGGVKNRYLMERLKKLFEPITMLESDAIGIPSDAKEAICFAMMGYYTIRGLPNSLAGVTGATQKAILGKICLPPVVNNVNGS